MTRMLGRHGWHIRGMSGQRPCSECDSGHYEDRRKRRRVEAREWVKESTTMSDSFDQSITPGHDQEKCLICRGEVAPWITDVLREAYESMVERRPEWLGLPPGQ